MFHIVVYSRFNLQLAVIQGQTVFNVKIIPILVDYRLHYFCTILC